MDRKQQRSFGKRLRAAPNNDRLVAGPSTDFLGGGRSGGNVLQPVRLVLLILDGPQEGENEFVEFPSIESAVAYGRELYGEPRFQLDSIEDAETGKLLVGFDHLNDLCREPPAPAVQQRRYG